MTVRASPTNAEVHSLRPANSPAEGCLLADYSLTVLYADEAFASTVGLPVAGIVGHRLAALFENCADFVIYRIARTVIESATFQEATENIGNRRVHFRAHPLPAGIVIVCSDATVRQLDDGMLETALHCRLVLEQLPVVHWTVDCDLRITRSIGAGLTALGLAEGEATGLTLFEYLRTTDPEILAIRMHRRALNGERVRYADIVHRRHYDVTLEPLRDSAGSIVGVIGMAHDVTDRHTEAEERSRLQEQFWLAQKRESLGVLAAGVAHDFNNLLSAIVGSAGLLLRELPAGGGPRESAALIKKAAERAAEVTRQMLVYAGKTVPSRRPLDVSHLVRDNLPLMTAAFPRKVSLETRLADGLPQVSADPGQLQQVVMNLVMNAGEAAAANGGLVTLATGSDAENGTSTVYVEVVDDGCGMPPEVRSRIFDPFFTTKGRGRGLGLSAVQGIVSSHGGHIQLTTEPGRGTTFRVVLPVSDDVPVAPSNPR